MAGLGLKQLLGWHQCDGCGFECPLREVVWLPTGWDQPVALNVCRDCLTRWFYAPEWFARHAEAIRDANEHLDGERIEEAQASMLAVALRSHAVH